jgi:hypothetical protein
MSHINSIGAGMYSDLSVSKTEADIGTSPATLDQAGFDAMFDTSAEYDRMGNVREFPAMGTPPNVVNVPVYGQSTSQQIQGQADAPSMEIQLNYVAEDWYGAGSVLGTYVRDGKQHVFRFALMNSEPPGYDSQEGATGLSGVLAQQNENSYWYWIGKIEALQVTPQLTDANTATVTITLQSDFYGAYTITATV